MGGKGKGKQSAKNRWSQWSCQECGASSNLERDPSRPDVCYCAACWWAWWDWVDTNAPRKGSRPKGQSEQGKGKGKSHGEQSAKNRWSQWSCQECGASSNLERDPSRPDVCYCAACWWAWWDWVDTNAPRKGSRPKGQSEQGKGKGKSHGEQAKGKGKKGAGKGKKGDGKKGGGLGLQWRPDPPVDEPGEWVPTDEFRGRKSFAFYRCPCNKTWVSAHGYKDYGQGCQACDIESLPVFMWKNENKSVGIDLDDTDKPARALDGPHDEERCAACRAGGCVRGERRY